MKTRGWGPWRENWFSFCSMHYKHDDNCHICQSGFWKNHWNWKIGCFVYFVSPTFWIWYNNRK